MIRPKHDRRILDLLETKMVFVKEEYGPLPPNKSGESPRPGNLIFVRSRRHPHIIMPAILHPGFGNFPRFRVGVPDGEGGFKHVWFSATRTVWLHYHPRPTSNHIAHIDEDPWNYNIWNLVPRDQNEQNYQRVMKEGKPEEDVPPSDDEEVPF